MHQRSLLDDESTEPHRAVVGIVGSSRTLTRAQRKFNQLIERISRQRQELDGWRAFRQTHFAEVAGQFQPAMARLREKQVAMVRLLDRILDGNSLVKRERVKAQAILVQMLAPLLAESQDAALEAIHDKHAPRSFRDELQDQLDALRTLAGAVSEFSGEASAGVESPEEFAEWLNTQVRADRPEAPERPPRKKSAKAIAREALREQTVQGGTRAVREVFRKLVSELHPDREADPVERARKTELMQRVNQAYKAGDLLTLLELQLSIEKNSRGGCATSWRSCWRRSRWIWAVTRCVNCRRPSSSRR